ncbi:MAG: hypothetical protein U5L10_03940 [Candidatus Moranbacteria bacterium]|nr:hypothetical protein [Candidatus Moranbacteria bacterium]
MLFKDLPAGSQFIFKNAVEAGDGDNIDIGVTIYIKLRDPIFQDKPNNPVTAVSKKGVPITITDDVEVYLLQ